MGAESAFEEGAGEGGGVEDVVDADAVESVGLDEADGGGDFRIGDGDEVGGLAGGDAEGITLRNDPANPLSTRRLLANRGDDWIWPKR